MPGPGGWAGGHGRGSEPLKKGVRGPSVVKNGVLNLHGKREPQSENLSFRGSGVVEVSLTYLHQTFLTPNLALFKL